MITCWAAKGGVGTTTVVAGMALALAPSMPVLVVDLVGDLGAAFGVDLGIVPGVAEWSRAGGAVPPDALDRLARRVRTHVRVVPRGRGAFDLERLEVLAALVGGLSEVVVVDAGSLDVASLGTELVDSAALVDTWPGAAFVERAMASLLVVRACPVALERVTMVAGAVAATGVVLVRDPGRSLDRRAFESAAMAPVVAELDLDPAVGAAADAGLAGSSLPSPYLRALEAVGRWSLGSVVP